MTEIESARTLEIERYKLIRERWDKEDELLNTRTGVFLTANSILPVALGFQMQSLPFKLGIALFGLILSILWLMTSWHSFNIIRALFRLCRNDMPYDLDAIYKVKPILFRPNTVFCFLIPGVVIIGWLSFIVWSLT